MTRKILSIIAILIILLISLFALTGCTSFKSYTYNVTTGDKIKIKIATNNGYDITSNLPFTISKDGKRISQGNFCTISGYNQYIYIANNDKHATILDSGNKHGVEYTFYKYEYPGKDTEYDYVMKVNNSNTGLLMGSTVSQQDAQNAFERLTFTLEK